MDNHIIKKLSSVVPYTYEYESENDHICRSYAAICGTFMQHKTIKLRNTCKIIEQQRVMLNKIVNINHTVTKFATSVPDNCMIMFTNVGKKRTTFAEITLKIEWTPVRGPEHEDVHKGEGVNGHSYHYEIWNHCSICLAFMRMCKKFGKKTSTFAEVTQQSMEHSYNTRTYAS